MKKIILFFFLTIGFSLVDNAEAKEEYLVEGQWSRINCLAPQAKSRLAQKILLSQNSSKPSPAIELNRQYKNWLNQPRKERMKGTPLNILLLSPSSLEEYIHSCKRGFDTLRDQGLPIQVETKFLPTGNDIELFINEQEKGVAQGGYDIVLIHFHTKFGKDRELGEEKLLEANFDAAKGLVYLWHRPGQALSVFRDEINENKLDQAHTHLLLGQSFVESFQKEANINSFVRPSFHGMTAVNQSFNREAYLGENGFFPVFGGRIPFDQMRLFSDVIELMQVFQRKLIESKETKVLLYLGTRPGYGGVWDKNIKPYKGNSSFWFLSSEEIVKTIQERSIESLEELKSYLYKEARGRIIMRTDFPEASDTKEMNSLVEWEKQLVTSYFDLFREDSDPEHKALKVEYAGSIHQLAAGVPMIPAIFLSPSGKDLIKDEFLDVFPVYTNNEGTILTERTIDGILARLAMPNKVVDMMENNIEVGNYLSIEKAMFGQYLIFKELLGTRQDSIEGPIKNGSWLKKSA